MKKLICCMIVFCMSIQVCLASSYCVLNEDDKRVIEQENMYETQSVASISKIMTAIIAIEKGNLNDKWNVGNEILNVEGSSIYLKVDQEVNLRCLLYGLMMRSGNDAAYAIAIRIAKTKEKFVDLMNEKAKEIGMQYTTFSNPCGLDEEDGGNISCAYDMALLMSYCMKNKHFVDISNKKYYKSAWGSVWKNKNKLLFEDGFVVSGKTGFTKKAGRTLVSSSSYNNIHTSVVTLRMHDDFEFHTSKHQKAIQNTKSLCILKSGTYEIEKNRYIVKNDIMISSDKDDKNKLDIYSRVENGKWRIEVKVNDRLLVYEFLKERR